MSQSLILSIILSISVGVRPPLKAADRLPSIARPIGPCKVSKALSNETWSI